MYCDRRTLFLFQYPWPTIAKSGRRSVGPPFSDRDGTSVNVEMERLVAEREMLTQRNGHTVTISVGSRCGRPSDQYQSVILHAG